MRCGQLGAVLFFTLIALVVMTIASLALIRAVDTSALIAGNIGFRQTATSSADMGIDTIVNFLQSKDTPTTPSDTSQYLNNSHPADGYYAVVNTSGVATNTVVFNIADPNSWVAGQVGSLSSTDATLAGNAGDTAKFVIERECLNNGALPANTNCLLSGSQINTSSSGGIQPSGPAPTMSSGSPVYRVTIQVAGPNNSLSLVQAFLF